MPMRCIRPGARRSSTVAQIAVATGTAPLIIPTTDESIHCCAIGSRLSGIPIHSAPSSAMRGRSARSTAVRAAGRSISANAPSATRASVTTPGSSASSPIAISRNDEPQIAAIAPSSSQSAAANAPAFVPADVAGRRERGPSAGGSRGRRGAAR